MTSRKEMTALDHWGKIHLPSSLWGGLQEPLSALETSSLAIGFLVTTPRLHLGDSGMGSSRLGRTDGRPNANFPKDAFKSCLSLMSLSECIGRRHWEKEAFCPTVKGRIRCGLHSESPGR